MFVCAVQTTMMIKKSLLEFDTRKTAVGDFDMRKLDFFFPAVKPQKAVAAGAK